MFLGEVGIGGMRRRELANASILESAIGLIREHLKLCLARGKANKQSGQAQELHLAWLISSA